MSMLTRLEESLAAAQQAEREARRAAERAQLHVVHCEGVVRELASQLEAEQLVLAPSQLLQDMRELHELQDSVEWPKPSDVFDCEVCDS